MSEPEPCGCCEGAHGDEPPQNPPGLPALHYRIATYGRFLERMLHALPLALPDQDPSRGPLARLTTRTPDDPSVALLDACACVADVLTFYQERIANECFLRTATERRSVLELARAIGYELAPGVAASVQLSVTVEDVPGAPGVCLLPKGSQVQSVPPPGKLPQVFETSAELTARAEWNALRPRRTRPAELVILSERVSPPGTRLGLAGKSGSFPDDTPGLVRGLRAESFHRVEAAQEDDALVDVIEISRLYFTEAAANLAKGELLLFVGRKGEETETLVLRVADVAAEHAEKRVRVDLEPLPDPVVIQYPPPKIKLFPYLRPIVRTLATVQLASLPLDREQVERAVLSKTWRERDLQALIRIQRWQGASIVETARTKPPDPPVPLETGVFSFREKLGFFGHNAPKWKSLPTDRPKDLYPKGWDPGDTGVVEPRTIWQDSQGDFPSSRPHTSLERPVTGLVQGSWVVIDSPEVSAVAYSVVDAREESRADYGLSGRGMGLTLADAKGQATIPSTQPHFHFRNTTARVNSGRLGLAELPIATPIERENVIELDGMVLGLAAGQAVVLRGERFDLRGVEGAEVAVLSDVIHEAGRTTLLLEDALQYSYKRDKLVLNANTVHATHGETVREVLGSGDGSVANQRFALKKPPLTYVSAPNPRGRSTLEVRVHGVRWDEATSLYGQGQREIYVVRIDDDARAEVLFGDGEQGARLPTGSVNVQGTYRSGIGPDGEIGKDTLSILRAMPLGLRGITNALPATGAAGPEHLQDARRNAPLTVTTLDRIVSFTDFEDFARSFQGVGKARADRLWVEGRDLVFLTVAGATEGEPGADVLSNLELAIARASDGAQLFRVRAFVPRFFNCRARVAVDARLVAMDVLDLVRARLLEEFGFAARGFGQPVTAAEVVAAAHRVPGVLAVDLDRLEAYDEGPARKILLRGRRTSAVAARPARREPKTGTLEPAELLLANPVGIDLVEMVP